MLEEAKQAHADSWAKLKAGGIPGPKVAEALWDHNYKKHDVISRQYDLDWSQYELTEAKAKYDALDTWHRTTFAAPEQPPAAQERTPLTAPIAPEGQPPEGPANTHVATLSDKVPAPQDPHTTGNQSPSQPDSSLPPPDQTPFATGEEPNPAAQEGAPTTPPAPGATPIPEPEPGTGEALDRLLGTPGPRSAKGMVDAIQDWRTAAIERSAKLYQDSDPKRYIAEADAIDRRAKVALAQHAQQHVRHSVASQSAAPGGLMTLKTGLEKAGMNPDKLEPSLKASFDAYQKAVADPSLRVPRHSPVTPINVNGTPVAWVSTQEQRNGITDVRLMVADKEAEAKGKTDVKPISIRLPSVTDDDINKRKAELDQKFQDAIAQQNGVLDDEKKQDNAPFSIKGMFTPDTNFVAAKEKAAAEVVKARVACEQFEQNGKDILFKERLTEELKKDKYNGAIGEQSYGNSVILGLADAGTAALAIPARVADAYNGDDHWMNKVGEIKSAYEGAFPETTVPGTENNRAQQLIRGGAAIAPYLAGGFVTRGLAGPGATVAMDAGSIGIGGAGASVNATSQAYLETQQRINEALASGDQATAERLRLGRDLHAFATGALTAGSFALTPNDFGAGIKGALVGNAVNTASGAVQGIIQHGIVDPIRGDESNPGSSFIDDLINGALTHSLVHGTTVAGQALGNALGKVETGPVAPHQSAPEPKAPSTESEPLQNAAKTAKPNELPKSKINEQQKAAQQPTDGPMADTGPGDFPEHDPDLNPNEASSETPNIRPQFGASKLDRKPSISYHQNYERTKPNLLDSAIEHLESLDAGGNSDRNGSSPQAEQGERKANEGNGPTRPNTNSLGGFAANNGATIPPQWLSQLEEQHSGCEHQTIPTQNSPAGESKLRAPTFDIWKAGSERIHPSWIILHD